MQLSSQRRFRFGPFELDATTQILLRNGYRVKLQRLPFEMLRLLLEADGSPVSRQALREHLWTDGTFVDFDNGLNVVVAKLREALGDQASGSKFIETVPGRGYRFAGTLVHLPETKHGDPLEPTTPDPPPSPATTPQTLPDPLLALASEPTLAASGSDILALERPPALSSLPATRFALRPTRRVTVMAACLAVAILLVWLVVHRRATRAQVDGGKGVMIGDFANMTGDPRLDDLFTAAFRLKLQESPSMRLVLPNRQGAVSSTLAEELSACQTLHVPVLVDGQLTTRDSGYEILLSERRCSDGRLLRTQIRLADSQRAILPALGSLIEEMRHRMGEPTDSSGRFQEDVTRATTSSAAAMKAFSLGEQQRAEGKRREAIDNFKLATDLDPQFALAYARLGSTYLNNGQPMLGREAFALAFRLRERTTDRERLYITGHFYADVTGEIGRAIDAYQLWRSLYPYDVPPNNNLAILFLAIGEPEKAIDPARTAVALNPADKLSVTTLAQTYLGLGDYVPLNSLCNDPHRYQAGTISFREACFVSSFAQGDRAAMQIALQTARGTPTESALLYEEAQIASFEGRWSESQRTFHQAVLSATRDLGPDAAASMQLYAALIEADLGYRKEAREQTREMLRLPSLSMTYRALAALVLARTGDPAAAEPEMERVQREAPLDTLINDATLAAARASLAMDAQRPDDAVAALKPSGGFDLAPALMLAPPFYRGQMLAAMGQPGPASEQFRRVIQAARLAPQSIYINLARLRLGRALQLAGDDRGAAEQYDQLDTLWNNADPNFPPLHELHAFEQTLHRKAR